MLKQCALTTIDNPFNPLEQFDEWFRFDVEKGYYSCSRLARIMVISSQMSDEELMIETERAIDEIIYYDPINIYKKVSKEIVDVE